MNWRFNVALGGAVVGGFWPTLVWHGHATWPAEFIWLGAVAVLCAAVATGRRLARR